MRCLRQLYGFLYPFRLVSINVLRLLLSSSSSSSVRRTCTAVRYRPCCARRLRRRSVERQSCRLRLGFARTYAVGMEVMRKCCLAAAFMVFTSVSLLPPCESADMSAAALDSALRDYALQALVGSRTGVVYDVPLPSNLSGIRISAMRVRRSILWSRGANISSFMIRPGTTTTVPFARRIVLVCQNLGNWSSSYYGVPGYSLAAPVVGLLAYDASNGSSGGTRELKFAVVEGGRRAVAVNFPDVELPEPLHGKVKCAGFRPDGSAGLSETTPDGACSTEGTGHFAIVVPSAPAVPPPEGGSRWKVVVVAVSCACGVVGVAVVGLVGVGMVRLMRNKKLEELERRAEQEEGLGTRWVGSSKMPNASMIRTQPAIEEGVAPPSDMNNNVHKRL